jgi:hypothetical protein
VGLSPEAHATGSPVTSLRVQLGGIDEVGHSCILRGVPNCPHWTDRRDRVATNPSFATRSIAGTWPSALAVLERRPATKHGTLTAPPTPVDHTVVERVEHRGQRAIGAPVTSPVGPKSAQNKEI